MLRQKRPDVAFSALGWATDTPERPDGLGTGLKAKSWAAELDNWLGISDVTEPSRHLMGS